MTEGKVEPGFMTPEPNLPDALQEETRGLEEDDTQHEAAKMDAHGGCFTVESTRTHTHTFILLHGLGSNGEKFGQELLDTAVTSSGSKLQSLLPNVKFIFPTAARRRSSAFNRSILTQWFDIANLRDPSIRQEIGYKGFGESARSVTAIIESESQTLPCGNIILGGLSQGCAMSLSVLLSLEYSIGGYIGMNGWLPLQKVISQLIAEEDEQNNEDDPFDREESNKFESGSEHPMVLAASLQREVLAIDSLETSQDHTSLLTPIFLGHGEADPKVPSNLGESAAQTLSQLGMDVTWKLYADQGHWYKIPDEIDDIVDFLRQKTNVNVAKSGIKSRFNKIS